MKRWMCVVAALGLAVSPVRESSAQIPQTLSYQGRLLGVGGAPVSDGDYDLSFAVYDVPSGPDAPLWTEDQTAIPVSAGYFHVVLGSVSPLGLAFDAPYWLGVSIGGGAELTPRVELASSPYSLNARSVADGAVTASKIATGSVVKSLNGLYDDVTIAPGSNITVTPSGQTLTIAATGVGLTLPYSGVVSDPGTLLLVSNSGDGGGGSFRTSNANNSSPALHAVSTGNGPALFADGVTNVGGTSRSGELRLYRTGVAGAMLQQLTQPTGGRLQLHDEAANQVALLVADNDGTGAYLSMNRDATNGGFIVDGNYLNTSEPRVDVQGSVRSVTFEMGATASNSVRLPVDAIDGPEMLDEPGIGFRVAGSVTLDGTDKTITSRSITAPAAGYAVVIGTVQARANHVNGAADAMVFGVSNAVGTILAGWSQNVLTPGSMSTNTYYTPVTVQGVFPVTAGSTTFYLLGREDSGVCTADNGTITVLYFPTAYGLVTAPPAGAAALTPWTEAAAVTSGAGGSDVAAERAESAAFDRERVDRELRAMRSEMETLRRALEEGAAREARGDDGFAASRAR